MKATVLVVEDEEKLRRVVELQLKTAGFEVEQAGTAEDGAEAGRRADVILTDLRLPGHERPGACCRSSGSQDSHTPVIVMTAFGSIETAVEAMKAGAVDFLPKPFSLDHLMTVVNKALEVRSLRDENRELRAELSQRYEFDNIIGRSAAMREIFATIERVAPTRATVLLCGESGVGKDMIARAIHQHSPRADKPFVKINCTALPENLMESELFGYEKGAFTGANISKPGKFEQADTGTVFLDEIGDVPPAIQVKLLRILQEREFERLGSNKTRHIDVRVLAATNVDLRAALEQGDVPRGSVLSPERAADQYSAAARSQGRYSVPGEAFRRETQQGSRQPGGIDFRCRHRAADGVSLARQRARTGERDRAQPGAWRTGQCWSRPISGWTCPRRREPPP